MKYRWLSCPTQLATKGQWWSNRRMHLPHVSQCLERGAWVEAAATSGQDKARGRCTFVPHLLNITLTRSGGDSTHVDTHEPSAHIPDKGSPRLSMRDTSSENAGGSTLSFKRRRQCHQSTNARECSKEGGNEEQDNAGNGQQESDSVTDRLTHLLHDAGRAQRLAAQAAFFRQPVDYGLLHGRVCCKVPRFCHNLRSDRGKGTTYYVDQLPLSLVPTCLPTPRGRILLPMSPGLKKSETPEYSSLWPGMSTLKTTLETYASPKSTI